MQVELKMRKKKKSLALQSVLEELKKKLERKKQVVVIPCSRKTKQTVYFIQGRRHVVVYIRTTGCVNLNTGLPRRLQQSTNVLTTPHHPQTKSPGPLGSTFQFWPPPAPRPMHSNPDICVTATRAGCRVSTTRASLLTPSPSPLTLHGVPILHLDSCTSQQTRAGAKQTP